MISGNFDKNNLHHAYLIEGAREEILPEVLGFLEEIGMKTAGNPDFCQIVIDNFKTEEALNLRGMAGESGFTEGKKVFVICANTFSLDAEQILLKMFEEPIPDTHFFVVVPDTNILLKTLVSRFYFISTRQLARQFTGGDLTTENKEAEKFIAMALQDRIDFIKDLLLEAEVPTEVGIPTGVGKEEEILPLDSARSKSLKFLNALEYVLHQKMPRTVKDVSFFDHIFKVREYLRMPGSSAKTLMESVALSVPQLGKT